MRIYLDNCCFNRPFDDQSGARIRLETEAKLEVQQRIRDGRHELVWPYILDFANEANPFVERRQAIARWKAVAAIDVAATEEAIGFANDLLPRGIRPKDALHVACATVAGSVVFLTTDDALLRKAHDLDTIRVMNPTQFIIEVDP